MSQSLVNDDRDKFATSTEDISGIQYIFVTLNKITYTDLFKTKPKNMINSMYLINGFEITDRNSLNWSLR